MPRADIIMPNHVELEYLASRPITDLDSALSACEAMSARGPALVVVTSLRRGDTAPGTLETLAMDRTGAWLVATPVLAGKLYGAGDLFTALFLATYLKTRTSAEALVRAVAGTYGILKMTSERGASELALIAAQGRDHSPERTLRGGIRRVASGRFFQITADQDLGDLDRVQRRALAQVVRYHPTD